MIKLDCFGITDKGLSRERNEDFYICDPDLNLFAVADGLGGLSSGDMASRLTISYLKQHFFNAKSCSSKSIKSIITSINKNLFDKGRIINAETGIGSTLTFLKINNKKAFIGHIGDSSAYLFRNNLLQKITHEHTMAGQLCAQHGEAYRNNLPEYFSHALTQCIGPEKDVDPQVEIIDIQDNDLFLVCTDGVNKIIDDEELVALLLQNLSPEQIAKSLVDLSNEKGGPDNITVVVVKLKNEK